MAKAPRPAMVKTRAHESLQTPAVTALYRFLLGTRSRCNLPDHPGRRRVMFPSRSRRSGKGKLGKHFGSWHQRSRRFIRHDSTLSFRTFRCRRPRPSSHLIAIGLTLLGPFLESAFEILATRAGRPPANPRWSYYLVGARCSRPTALRSDPRGTKSALDRLLAPQMSLDSQPASLTLLRTSTSQTT